MAFETCVLSTEANLETEFPLEEVEAVTPAAVFGEPIIWVLLLILLFKSLSE